MARPGVETAPHSVEIIEMGPRDGLQNEKTILSTDHKVEFIERLIRSGARRIEAASFVHPRLVPSMADAEAVMSRVPRAVDVIYAGLALNGQGIRRAVAAEVGEIDFVIPVTDAFAKANQDTTIDRLIEELAQNAEFAAVAGIPITVTFAVAFGCPFQGEVPPRQVVDVISRTIARTPVKIAEVALADTIGCGVPRQTSELIGAVTAVADSQLRLHLHETRHTSIANAMAAVDAGATRFDASVGGLGGCPFAPGAAGNAATEDLAWAMHRQGFQTGLDLDGAVETANWVCEQLGKPPQSGLAKAGTFP